VKWLLRKILILAGGGGHTGYAQILADELKGRAELSFLSPDDEPISVRRLEGYGPVRTMTKPRHPTTPALTFMWRLLKAFFESLSRVPSDIDVVVSTGSSFCVPPAIVAWMKRIPVVNLESRVKFTKPSGTASLLRRFSRLTALQWEEQKGFLEGTVFGPLLPRRLVEPSDGGYILVSGGTYGYKELFDALDETDLENVVLQTGKIDGGSYAKAHPGWRVMPYSDRFYELIAGARVVVSPPGGTPVEAVAYGKPVVIVEYPAWTKAADLEETRLFAEKIGASLITDVTAEKLVSAIEEAQHRPPKVLEAGNKGLVEAILSIAGHGNV
jgi:UDP-N-acetylglucosamine--N-acetylmuramyl-(pentapeptide) pyrophosphoryl-undecaprenol N-acetylglucosamine transferase